MSDLYCAECARELALLQDDICGFCAKKLEARIAELEKLAVVWHKYPDEKPDKDGWYITSYKGQIRRHFWDSRRAFFDTNPTDIPYVENTQPTHYAEYPAPPEE